MHHFTAHTYRSLSVAGVNDGVWQIFVPRQALKYDYLMHGLMGLAALHLSHETPNESENYLELSRTHQKAAFASFRHALDEIDKDNCHAVFAFSVMAMVFAIGTPLPYPVSSNTVVMDKMFVLYEFLHGISTITEASREWIGDGPFGDFTDMKNRMKWNDVDDRDQALLKRLHGLNHALLAVVDPCAHAAIKSAIDGLEMTFRGGEILVLAWLSMCGDHYMTLLRQGQRLARLVFIHWCIMLNRLDRVWWVKDNAKVLFEDFAVELLGLGKEWSDAVQDVKARFDESPTSDNKSTEIHPC
ncbi:hypothetical protein H2198_006993 [Neophaeococcomyces mojaviensis]|uniref:Uncharacterized protein n=1 Tax=Neophaeococcomyces mojaviensis TaxID=3383035 RepID=A0ACC3A190_9EURO|nr:hypothetical protein H2198_006993 [Knufia sp. JES_112]